MFTILLKFTCKRSNISLSFLHSGWKMHILSQNPLYVWLTKPIEHLQQIIQRPSNKVDLVNDTVKFIFQTLCSHLYISNEVVWSKYFFPINGSSFCTNGFCISVLISWRTRLRKQQKILWNVISWYLIIDQNNFSRYDLQYWCVR